MHRLLFIIAVVAACDPGVRAEFRLRTSGPSSDSVLVQATAISRSRGTRYGLMVFAPATDVCQQLSATGSDQVRGQSVMLRLCIDYIDSSQVRIMVLEAFTKEWGPRGDSLRHELGDTLSKVFGSALSVR